jgi:cobalt-zinc-cadmium efflux system outer membrane protein
MHRRVREIFTMSTVRCSAAFRCIPIVLCLFSSPLQAATATKQPSLEQMVRAAAARNPGAELAAAQRGIGAALQRKADQPLAAAPIANVKYQTDRVGSDLGYREWEGGVELPLWLPGQADAFVREAEQQQRLSDAMQAARELEIAGEVRERLWSAALARSDAEQARSARDRAQELFNDVQRRVAAGELPRSDNLLAENELVQREDALQQALNRANQAAALFKRFTGFDALANPAVESPAAAEAIDPQHPLLSRLHGEVERARAHRDRLSKTQRGGPNLWVGAKSARALAGEDYESAVGIELSMPFGDAVHYAPDLAEAEAALTEAQVEHSRTRLQLEDSLSQVALELERAAGALAQTERRRELANESLKLSRRAFELGETDLVRLLQAQADALSARHDYRIRQLQHGQAIARLNQASGVIPR